MRVAADAPTREAALYGIDRMRFVLGLDHDLSEFHARFRSDPVLGPVIRRWPRIRPQRKAEPFEALAFAITEQLIEGRAGVRDPATADPALGDPQRRAASGATSPRRRRSPARSRRARGVRPCAKRAWP